MRFLLCILSFSLILAGCSFMKNDQLLRRDLFNVQTRLLKIERRMADGMGAPPAQNVASTLAELEKVKRDIRQLNGEIDRLRVGVQTGRVPGEAEDESLGARFDGLMERMATIESDQRKILAALGSLKSKAPGVTERKYGKLQSLGQLRTAFQKNQFLYVAEDAGKILKKAAKKDRAEVMFMEAESLYKLGKVRDAALKFNEFVESKPPKKYLSHAKLRMGDCFRHLGDLPTAKIYYEELTSKHKTTPEAKTAKDRLAKYIQGRVKTGA